NTGRLLGQFVLYPARFPTARLKFSVSPSVKMGRQMTTRTFGQFNARWRELNRTPRRQRLVKHLIECGERPVLEALLAVDGGQPLDVVWEDFCGLPPEPYQAVGADVLPIDEVTVVDGGRR